MDRRQLFDRIPRRLQPVVAGVYRSLFPNQYVPLMYDHPPHPGEDTINPASLESVPDTLPERHYQDLEIVGDRFELLEHFPSLACGAEIGVAQGDFASQIYARTEPKDFYLIDIWRSRDDEATVRKRFEHGIDDGSVHLLRGESTDILPQFEDGFLDFVYLDTTHHFNQTLAELRAAEKRSRATASSRDTTLPSEMSYPGRCTASFRQSSFSA